MSIDTTIDGDPGSLRASGEWLRSLPVAVSGVGDAVQAAFQDAVGKVQDAWSIERNAYDRFLSAATSFTTNTEESRSSSVWLGVGATATYVSTASYQYWEWTKTSDARADQMSRFITIAGESNPAVARSAAVAVEVFGPANRQAAALVEQNKRLIGPLSSMPKEGRVMTLLAGNIEDMPRFIKGPNSPIVQALPLSYAGKLPILGVVVTGGQTAYEIYSGADPGRTIVGIGGGLLVGAGATALIAGTAAPALVVIAGGFIVAWGAS